MPSKVLSFSGTFHHLRDGEKAPSPGKKLYKCRNWRWDPAFPAPIWVSAVTGCREHADDYGQAPGIDAGWAGHEAFGSVLVLSASPRI